MTVLMCTYHHTFITEHCIKIRQVSQSTYNSRGDKVETNDTGLKAESVKDHGQT